MLMVAQQLSDEVDDDAAEQKGCIANKLCLNLYACLNIADTWSAEPARRPCWHSAQSSAVIHSSFQYL